MVNLPYIKGGNGTQTSVGMTHPGGGGGSRVKSVAQTLEAQKLPTNANTQRTVTARVDGGIGQQDNYKNKKKLRENVIPLAAPGQR